MAVDFQFIAYRGAPIDEPALAAAIRSHVPSVTTYRHARSVAAEGTSEVPSALHAIAVYEERNATIRMLLPDIEPSLEGSVQAAWTLLRRTMQAMPQPSADPSLPAEETGLIRLARVLSRSVGRTCWVSRGDNSSIGGFALFERGALLETAAEDGAYLEGDDYVRIPDEKWRAAMTLSSSPIEFFARVFPDAGDPPLRDVSTPENELAFDIARFDVSLE